MVFVGLRSGCIYHAQEGQLPLGVGSIQLVDFTHRADGRLILLWCSLSELRPVDDEAKAWWVENSLALVEHDEVWCDEHPGRPMDTCVECNEDRYP